MTNTEPLDENSWRMGRDAAAREIADAQANVQEALGLLAEARTALADVVEHHTGEPHLGGMCPWMDEQLPRLRDLLARIPHP